MVGLTGGIGSGKSTVAALFGEYGIPVYNSDREAKAIMANDPQVRQRIMTLLGAESYDQGELNRIYIAQRVFNDPESLQALNAIVHPAVRQHFVQWAHQQQAPYVIQEAAIIFENGTQDAYDHVILVTAPVAERVKRVVDRDRVSPEEVMARMRNQWEDSRKIQLADFVIVNSELNETKGQVADIHTKLLKINP